MWIRLFNILYRKHKSWMRQQGTPPTWDRDKVKNSIQDQMMFKGCLGGDKEQNLVLQKKRGAAAAAAAAARPACGNLRPRRS